MKNTRAILAILITIIGGLVILLQTEFMAEGIGLLTTVWASYAMGKMDWNKPSDKEVEPQ